MPASAQWRYLHHDFREAMLPDGYPVRRPAVTVKAAGAAMDFVAVVDSGSPISIADSGVFEDFGIDPTHDDSLYEVPLGFGGAFGRVPVFEVELELLPPPAIIAPGVRWRLHLGSRTNWRMPFSVLLGQRGWFDQFPTTIDGTATAVHLPDR